MGVVSSQLLSCQAGDNDCEGVTVGYCMVPFDDVIQNVNLFTDVRDCQFYCNALTNCELFRFNGTECTLLTKDYRKDCQKVAGPFDKLIDECFEIDTKNTCDLLLQEDCSYDGAVILEPPVGTIADPQECEELCKQFEPLGCTYWVFSQIDKLCSLRGSDEKTCNTWAGPRSPAFDECQGGTTVMPPTTEGPTEGPTTKKDDTTKADPTTPKADTTTPKAD